MKKLMAAVAIVCAAAMAQAASFEWNNSLAPVNAYNDPGDYGAFASGTMYLIQVSDSVTQAAFISAVLGADDYKTAFDTFVSANAYNSGAMTDSAFTSVKTGSVTGGNAFWTDSSYSGTTYAMFQVMIDTANNGVYVSELQEGSIQGTGDTKLAFANDGAYNNAAFGTSVTTFQGDGWYTATAVPEPTSGLLLLLGMAGLALKRKIA